MTTTEALIELEPAALEQLSETQKQAMTPEGVRAQAAKMGLNAALSRHRQWHNKPSASE